MHKLLPIAAAAILVAFAGAPALADDTEIYVGQSADGQNSRDPNVLFIVDTSGSMDSMVEIERRPYDPSKDYDDECVADDAGANDNIYWNEAIWDTKGTWQSHDDEWTVVPPCDDDQWVNADAMLLQDVNDGVASQSGMAIARAGRYEQTTREVCVDRWFGNCFEWEEQQVWEASHLQAGNHTDDVNYRDTDHGEEEEVYGFFSANYVNWFHATGGGTVTEDETIRMSRLEIVKDIALDLVNSISGVNVGLMRFDNDDYEGGFVDIEVGPMSQTREDLFTAVLSGDADYGGDPNVSCEAGQGKHGYCPGGSTPLSETLYEATRYLRGEGQVYGDESSPRESTASSLSGGSYDSPVDYSCQKNHIVYLTDGEPQRDSGADDEIGSLTGNSCGGYGDNNGNCLDELAQFLYEEDQRPDDVPGVNRVNTHTVGFFTDQELLDDAARKGHGEYYTADNYGDLKTALTTLFTNIISSTSLFTAPAVSVNAFNRLEHLNQVYFALFRPGDRAVWDGNVKRYELKDGQLVGANDAPAIDEATGEFAKSAQSFWSDVVDGNDVMLGGAANELPAPDTRVTYTDIDGDAAMESLHEDTDGITAEMLSPDPDDPISAGDRETYLKWIRGVDVDDEDGDGDTTDSRNWMGDPLHSRPTLVTYGSSESDPQLTMFVMTNEGYLHAIDTEDGSELWAYMPESLLANIPTQYASRRVGQREYGLDGPLTAASNDDRLHLYFGMRRGGRDYFALDAENRTSPETAWTIRGGEGDFAELGQTWSRPIATSVDIGGTEQDVLIFAGGYDPAQDEATTRTADSMGRAVFIVDASDGSLLWSGAGDAAAGDHDETFAAMDYSIPSDIRVLDIDNDGLADQMYVGDMGGQIWRFDIDNGAAADSLVTGGVIADLATDAEAGNRRFYYAPDIAPIEGESGQWLSLSIGSGFRAHPLDERIDDRFYMLQIEDVFEAPRNDADEIEYEERDEDDLYDATENLIGEGEDKEAELDKLDEAEGWYIRLTNSGEKVMAESVTLEGQVVFTTFQPDDGSAESCGPGAGIGRTYVVNVSDATPVMDPDDDGKTKEDRSARLKRAGIPPSPTIVFVDGEPRVLVGPEMPVSDLQTNFDPRRVYWSEQ